MKANQTSFDKMLAGKIQYRVPLFQRTYSWEREQWERLWEDITDIYVLDEPRPHFIGAIVTQAIPDSPSSASKHLLIDGQQRLTTLCTILAAIRVVALKSDATAGLSKSIDDNYLTNRTFNLPADELLKLRPTQQDRESFRAIAEGTNPPADSSIGSAFRFFIDQLERGAPDGQPYDLQHIFTTVAYYLDIVSITLDPADSAHKIFESLNNTGMGLGEADLIRNYIFMKIPTEIDAEQAYNDHWLPMQQLLSNRLNDFFWQYLMMNGSLPRRDDTYAELHNRHKEPSQADAINLLRNCSKYAGHYGRIFGMAENDPDCAFAKQMRRLITWDLDVAYSFIMKALDWVESNKLAMSDLVEVMGLIESYVVRRAICGEPTNRLRRIFAGLCSKEETGGSFVALVQEHLLANEWPRDEVFIESFVKHSLYSWSRGYWRKRLMLVLESLDRSFPHKEHAVIDDSITVEHVMPQTLTEEWKAMLGSEFNRIHEEWRHTPGNLTLTAYNPELSNAPFTNKKEILECSKFSLSDSILACERWGEDQIRERGQMLAAQAVQVWPRPGG